MQPLYLILVLNTGSSSTKVALYQNQSIVWNEVIAHPAEQLKDFASIEVEMEYRLTAIRELLLKNQVKLEQISVIGAIGGILKAMEGGVYAVNECMVADILNGRTQAKHASNLAAVIGYRMMQPFGKKCYIVDPISTDEMSEIAKITGLPSVPRKSRTHALNVKACYRRAIQERIIEPSQTLIVAHMGGGLTINLVQDGRITDVEDGRQNGPFSTEAAGGVPIPDFIETYWETDIPKKDLIKFWYGNGGVMAHLKTNSVKNVVEMALNGDKHADLIIKAMCYQVSKSVGAMYAASQGKVDALVLTGGIAQSDYIVSHLKQLLAWIKPIVVYPGEEELSAIADSVFLVMQKELPEKVYNE